MTDPIADMLTRIRNGARAKHEHVEVPASRMKLEIARILKQEGYIRNFRLLSNEKQGSIKVQLKYDQKGNSPIRYIQRVSKPGGRKYARVEQLPRVLNDLGIAIVSTSRGLMTAKEARQRRLGGEVICHIW